jgi:hypothetical protein
LINSIKFHRFPAAKKRFFRNPKRITRLWDPPNSNSVGKEVHFTGTILPRLGSRIRIFEVNLSIPGVWMCLVYGLYNFHFLITHKCFTSIFKMHCTIYYRQSEILTIYRLIIKFANCIVRRIFYYEFVPTGQTVN